MHKHVILFSVVLLFLLIGSTALIAVLYWQSYYSLIPDSEKTYSGTIIDTALYPHEITEWYSITRSQIGIDLDHCEECSICYDHYFTVSKHCNDSYNRGESVIVTVAKERGSDMYVIISITTQNEPE